MWKLTNKKRHVCETCGYQTHNLALFKRHINSNRHFLMTYIRTAPFDIKCVIASFLRADKVWRLGKVGEAAMRINYPVVKWMKLQWSLEILALEPFTWHA